MPQEGLQGERLGSVQGAVSSAGAQVSLQGQA